MEIPVKLIISADQTDPKRIDFVRIISYLSEQGPIIFDEQLEVLDIAFPQEVINRFKVFSQKHADFFSCLDLLEETKSTVSAIFIAGWTADACVGHLKIILEALELEYQIVADVLENEQSEYE